MAKGKLIILLISVTLLGILLAGCSNTAEKGLLQGKVNVGPISPVEQPGQTTLLQCEVYAARKIMIYDKNGDKLLMQVDIECNAAENYARYQVELAPGTYTVDINRIGIDYSDAVPVQVKISSGITTRLDIDIDTGIR